MYNISPRFITAVVLAAGAFFTSARGQNLSPIGIFQAQGDIGTVSHAGAAAFDSRNGSYTVSGSGENTWFGADEFHFVWLKVTGDVTLAADVALLGSTGKPHRKAMLMIRQNLDPDSPYVDVAIHGVGKTSLQFRDAVGANTRTIASNVYGPQRVMIQKRGDFYYAFLAPKGGPLQFAGSSTRLALTGEFYVGFGVCSHEKDVVQSALFSHVTFTHAGKAAPQKATAYSTLETVVVGSMDRQVEYTAPGRLEAPIWSKDGSSFLFSRDGGLFRLPVKCGAEDAGCAAATEPVRVSTGGVSDRTGDHGLSPVGSLVAISGTQGRTTQSLIYTVPLEGGAPRQVTTNGPSFWHGWSPDGATLAYTGDRGGSSNVFTIPSAGGEERQLTTEVGRNDDPDYSPDGRFLYFTSDRSGSMQIWRMRPDGSEQEQVLSDDSSDWSPHISPNGLWMVYLSFEKQEKGVARDRNVVLHLMSMKDKKVRVLATLLGGEGTIDAPSWSPDSGKLAFMSYGDLP